jgi:pseudaminic acid synthase
MNGHIDIRGRLVGAGQPVFVIAELSANHNQDFDHTVELLQAAKKAGADAVKLQTYTADTLTLRSDKKCFRIDGGTLWDGRTLHDLYKEAYMPWTWQPKLKTIAEELGMELFSTAFDESAVVFLESMNVAVHKIASFEIVDVLLIERMARTGKPLMMSTGMATYEEIEEAVSVARNAGATQIALLKCTSAYPASAQAMNLRTIPDLASRFQVPVGLSDHTLGTSVPVAAVALGACIVEKHFTLSRAVPGPDSTFSLEPSEFEEMVHNVRAAESALGEIRYGATDTEQKSRVFRRSLFVTRDVRKGEAFTLENVRSIRPGDGLHPRFFNQIIGRRANSDIEFGTPLGWELIETGTDQ